MNETPRSVKVSIGKPDELEHDPETAHVLSADESYSVLFTEEGGEEGFVAQCECLCTLGKATELWLLGESAEEVQSAMAKHATEHDE